MIVFQDFFWPTLFNASRLQFIPTFHTKLCLVWGRFRCHVVISVGLVIRVVLFGIGVVVASAHRYEYFLVHYINNVYIYDTMYIPFVIQREERYSTLYTYHIMQHLYCIQYTNTIAMVSKSFALPSILPQKSPGSIQWFHATAAGTMKALVTISAIHELQGKIHFFQIFCWWISEL